MAASPKRVAADALDLFTLQAADKAIALEAKLDGLPALTLIDADRVRQILLNLIGNAVKFTETGGVRLEAVYDEQGARLRFDVVDTGPGMSEDGVARLFKRFSQVDASSTRKHGGTGLGLAICKGLVDAMAGQIGVSSVLGQGSRFWFSIPAPRIAAAEPRAETLAVAFAFPPGCRVLVADDNAMNRALVRAVLTACDAQITEVYDGLQAVAAAATAPFDVILMDLRMPGLDGDAAARRIRAEDGPNDATPILAFSADATLDWAQGPFDGAITKPLSAQALVEGVAKALESTPVMDHAAA
jgi:CheY-like chemotaxis protein